MKKLLLLLLGVLLALPSVARDFKYTYEGQTITYTVINEDSKTCRTKVGNNKYPAYPGNYVSGSLVLPANPKDGDVEYTLTEIGTRAFYERSGLTSIEIPNSVESIGDWAFYECSGLTSIEIPNSVETIGECAFRCCSGLTSVVIPNSVTSIGVRAFEGCCDLTSLTVADGENALAFGYDALQDTPLETLYMGRSWTGAISKVLKTVTLGEQVKSLPDYAFDDCRDLTSIEIPNSVESIGSCAFSDCSGLTSVEIPNSVTSISDGTFCYCRGLTSVEIPNSVTSIGDGTFCYCSGLTSVEIPNSVSSIGDGAFYDCSGLTSVEIPNSVTSIGSSAFCRCSGLTSVEIPNSVTSIGSSAFFNCSGLTSVEIPNSVTSIGSLAFYDCSGLTSVEIPNSVTSIGSSAFCRCSGLTSVIYNTNQPITADKDFFDDSTYQDAELIIPKGTKEIFLATEPWNKFLNITERDLGGIEDVICDATDGEIDYNAPYDVYNLNGVKVGNSTDNLAPGLYIVRQGRVAKKIALN